MSRQLSKRMKELLPWYVNGTLDAADRSAVERGRNQSPGMATELAAWRRLRTAVRAQPEQRPEPVVWQRVLAQVRSSRPTRRQMIAFPHLAWVWGGVLALAIVLLLWGSIQPGIVLRWSAGNVPLTAFRVYRAAAGSTDFELVQEVPAAADAQQYTYVDPLLVPGRTYIYRVEGVGPGSQSVSSQAVVANAIEALPGQLAILLIGLAGGYVTVFLMPRLRCRGNGRWGLRLLTI